MRSFLPTVIFLLLIFALEGCSRSSSSDAGRPPQIAATSRPEVRLSTDVVKLSSSKVEIAAGGTAEATLTLSVSAGFHVNANPPSFPYLIPTSVEQHPDPVAHITMGKPVYPRPVDKKFAFSEQPIAVYEGEVPIGLPLRAERQAPKGEAPVFITVRVQACDHEKCYPPASVDFTVTLNVK